MRVGMTEADYAKLDQLVKLCEGTVDVIFPSESIVHVHVHAPNPSDSLFLHGRSAGSLLDEALGIVNKQRSAAKFARFQSALARAARMIRVKP